MSTQLARWNPYSVTNKASPWVRQTAAHVVEPAGHCRAPWGLIGEDLGLLVVWVSKSPTTASTVCELLFQKTGEDSLILDPELQPY